MAGDRVGLVKATTAPGGEALKIAGLLCMPIAASVSWEANGSALWAILHAGLSWGYLLYRVVLTAMAT